MSRHSTRRRFVSTAGAAALLGLAGCGGTGGSGANDSGEEGGETTPEGGPDVSPEGETPEVAAEGTGTAAMTEETQEDELIGNETANNPEETTTAPN